MTSRDGRRLGVLISGRGSNLEALVRAIQEGRLRAEIAIVISNVAGVRGLDIATAAGLETAVMPHSDYTSRADYDRVLVAVLHERHVDLVCLAGFMRRLGPTFCDAFPHAVMNIHPSLLPSFPGLHAQRQAIEHGVGVSGATVHLVTPELDAGPILLQEAVPVEPADDEDSLAARILEVEHRLYPAAVARVLEGGWRVDGRRVIWPSAGPRVSA